MVVIHSSFRRRTYMRPSHVSPGKLHLAVTDSPYICKRFVDSLVITYLSSLESLPSKLLSLDLTPRLRCLCGGEMEFLHKPSENTQQHEPPR